MKLKDKISKLIDRWLEKLFGDLGDFPDIGDDDTSPATADPSGEGGGKGPSAGKNTDAGDSLDFALLDWRWGGFKGGGAALADKPRIRDLKVTRDGLSYSWAQEGCEYLGAGGPHDAACIAAIFCRVGGKWLGGKFDWISTDRHTRGFENIKTGYHGWDASAISKADAFAFVIVSKDGRRRTNVATQDGGAR